MGDTVVVPRQGIGTVVERSVRRLAGTRREYLAIEVARGGMRLMIPTESPGAGRLRAISSRRVAKEALSTLESPPQELAENWRNRHNEASETLGSGELVAVAGLVRDLAHANQRKHLTGSDLQAYTSALELLRSELRAVLRISDRRVAAEVDRRLGL
ncbi:MAG TPA: CarD family transcriptional regulator [Solirubrobacterales bacterium]|nr:CarD family transcriptional regulator [Solirubrobacterales bacterium]